MMQPQHDTYPSENPPGYQNAPPATSAAQESWSGTFNKHYIPSLPGIFKILEMVFCLISFICVQSSPATVYIVRYYYSGYQYSSFTSMFALITTGICLFIILFNFQENITFIHWPKFMFFFFLFQTIHVFIGFIVVLSLSHSQDGAAIAGGVFELFAFVVFAADTYFLYKDIHGRASSDVYE